MKCRVINIFLLFFISVFFSVANAELLEKATIVYDASTGYINAIYPKEYSNADLSISSQYAILLIRSFEFDFLKPLKFKVDVIKKELILNDRLLLEGDTSPLSAGETRIWRIKKTDFAGNLLSNDSSPCQVFLYSSGRNQSSNVSCGNLLSNDNYFQNGIGEIRIESRGLSGEDFFFVNSPGLEPLVILLEYKAAP